MDERKKKTNSLPNTEILFLLDKNKVSDKRYKSLYEDNYKYCLPLA